MKPYIYYLGIVSMGIAFSGAYAQSRPFTVTDDIEMVRFSDPSASQDGTGTKFSPDGRYFAIVTSKGIIESDQIESTLSIFSSSESDSFITAPDTAIAPKPRVSIEMTAVLARGQESTYGSVITDLRWSLDSRHLYFIAERSGGDRQLYRMAIDGGSPIALSRPGYSVARFDFTSHEVVYSAWHSQDGGKVTEDDEHDNLNSDARVVTGKALKKILFPNMQPTPTNRELWIVHDSGDSSIAAPIPILPQTDISLITEGFRLSPKGHFLIQLRPTTTIPPGWDRYEPAKGFEYLRIREDNSNSIAPDNLLRLKEYSLVDLESSTATPLVQAPYAFALAYGGDSAVVWSPDERRVLLTNTFLPLNGANEPERTRRQQPCALAEIQLSPRVLQCIVYSKDLAIDGTGRILNKSLSFAESEDEITFTVALPKGRLEKRTYILNNDIWKLAKTSTSERQDGDVQADQIGKINLLTVFVKQSLNNPPTLWATDASSKRTRQLWDPNPQFAHLEFGQVSVYRWKDRTGHEWEGGLVTPVGYVPGKRYPLVIQIYNFDAHRFMTDGLFPTAMAARALASAGIVVLQVQRRYPHTFDDAEAQVHIEAFRSAIDKLSGEGLVDPKKVGLVGFSATAWYVENALIRDPGRFAAATIAEGIDISYMQYCLLGTSNLALAGEFEKIIGSKPIGDGLKQWIALAPGFHLDQIVAPLRIEAMGPGSILGEWEIYSSLQRQRKPVDLIYFPNGEHVHQRPLERLASQQGDVDWFRYWLQGYEDPDPSKKYQYKSWERMKASSTPDSGSGQ